MSKPLISVKMNPKQSESMQNTIKLTPGKQKQIQSALELLFTTYGDLIQNWGSLTDEQKQKVLEHSPCLNELKTLTEPLRS